MKNSFFISVVLLLTNNMLAMEGGILAFTKNQREQLFARCLEGKSLLKRSFDEFNNDTMHDGNFFSNTPFCSLPASEPVSDNLSEVSDKDVVANGVKVIIVLLEDPDFHKRNYMVARKVLELLNSQDNLGEALNQVRIDGETPFVHKLLGMHAIAMLPDLKAIPGFDINVCDNDGRTGVCLLRAEGKAPGKNYYKRFNDYNLLRKIGGTCKKENCKTCPTSFKKTIEIKTNK